jgi:hypothetical protein
MGMITLVNQSAFIKGRFILEIVVTTHEVLHSVVLEKSKGLVLKLDYEKVFYKVNIEFLLDLLEKRDFGFEILFLGEEHWSKWLGGQVKQCDW